LTAEHASLPTRLFYCSDIHGSQICFQKFLNAAKFYRANFLILGGDVTGKAIVPIVREGNSYSTSLLGIEQTVRGDAELAALERKIADMGYYYYVGNSHEVDAIKADRPRLDRLFTELMVQRLQNWLNLASERLSGTEVQCYVMPGNDDREEAIKLLDQSDCVTNPDRDLVRLDSHHEMISLGYANITPWKCPRDVPEDSLMEMIEEMVCQVKDIRNCIFNIHIPPYDSGIDVTTALDEHLKPVMTSSGPVQISAGSVSVRSAIEKYQPLLALHGHIHESRGVAKVGRTICLNPGSEYSEGILRGAVMQLSDTKVQSYLLTSG
jgi:Icc-related predicted phosphoesterase